MSNRWNRLGALAGVPFVGLVLAVTFLTGSTPNSKASGAKVIAFYHTHHTREAVAAYLFALSVVVGMFFYGALRGHLRQHPAAANLASTGFGGAVLFAAGAALSAGTAATLVDVPTRLSPSAAQALNVVGSDLTYYLFGTGLVVVMLASGIAIVRSGLLPRWLGWAAIVIAVAAVSAVLFWAAFLATGLWTLITSVTMYRRGEQRTIEIPNVRQPEPSMERTSI
jgi:hypothetical protein